jgi:geranylgeranyl diphosphate synthase type I
MGTMVTIKPGFPIILRSYNPLIETDIRNFLQEIDRQLGPYLLRSMDRIPTNSLLAEGIRYQIQGGGKRIRAALCATVCEIFCGSYEPALHFAAAIEQLQNFTLIHDDIADGDFERRGRPSTWKRFGLAHGINIGDVFASLSAFAILEADYPPEMKLSLFRLICELSLQVAEGQSLDISLRSNDSPTVEDYIECVRNKTGAFFAIATVGGGMIGGANQQSINSLQEFALHAGVAFQIKDDLLDLVDGKGRQPGSDVFEGKRTLLVTYAWQASSPQERTRLFKILNKPRTSKTPGEVVWVHDLFRRTKAYEQAERLANQYINKALGHLLDLPETPAKYRFIRLSKYLTSRVV